MTIHYSREGDIAVLASDNPPVNALGSDVRVGLSEGIKRAVSEGAKAVLIYGEGRTWFAGADIREFGKPPVSPILPEVCDEIEACPIPVIGALHGTVLGGGLEVAMSCHYRLALPSTKLGVPEVNLGLLPGAGGTQRLPRLAGYDAAISMVTSGRPVSAGKALETGIVDKVEDGAPRALGLAYATALVAEGAAPRPVGEMPAPQAPDFAAMRAEVVKKARGQLSPVTAFDAVVASATLPFREGLAEERRLFMSLMDTDQRKGLIHAFFAERQVSKLPELEGVAPRALQEIGVIGGGTMGAGIATAALLAGLNVTLIEMKPEACEAAHGRIAGNLAGALKRGKISQDKHDALLSTALTTTTDYATLSTADLIIEAVFENMDVKKQVFAQS